MTGPEHYLLAEELLAELVRDDGSVDFGDGGEAYVAAAQVHATLALAAATALNDGKWGLASPEDRLWRNAAGVP